jgi:hypothetical protein
MRFGRVRTVLQRAVLAGLPATLGACGWIGDDCRYEWSYRKFEIELPADPPMQLRIERCRLHDLACPDVCELVTARAQQRKGDRCDVRFHPDHVEVVIGDVRGIGNCPVPGRRPAGLLATRVAGTSDAVAAWFARAAWLEAASVPAFERLAHELAAHRAPDRLVRGALVAADDEVRHAAVMTRLARQLGAEPPPVRVADVTPRSLEAVAIENAVEGCVAETWSAAVALWQARCVRDAELQWVFARIALDETRHAELAWAIDAWARSVLDATARARLDAMRAEAARTLEATVDALADGALAAVGLPSAVDARRLFGRLRGALW